MSEPDTEGATRIVLPGTEVAEGVKVGDESNHYEYIPYIPEEPGEDPGWYFAGFPDVLLWITILLFAAVAAAGIGFLIADLF